MSEISSICVFCGSRAGADPVYDDAARDLGRMMAARGMRLDIPAGTAVRFEPGQTREVKVIPYLGLRRVVGFNAAVDGPLED